MFDGYVEVRESLYTRVIIWVHTILDHIDTRVICLGMKVLAWYFDPNGIKIRNNHQISISGIKICKILIIDT